MAKTLTPAEQLIRQKLATVKGYPRWKWFYPTKGFLYYIHSSYWVQEVFKHPDGSWSAGSERHGTFRHFSSLPAALEYGEEMARPSALDYGIEQAKIRRLTKNSAARMVLSRMVTIEDLLPVGKKKRVPLR